MTIGHSYLINVRDFSELKNVLLSRIIPLLQEYFYDDWHRIQLVFRDVKTGGEKPEPREPQIIKHKILEEKKVIGFDHDDFEDSIEYWVAPEDQITPDAIRKIYEESSWWRKSSPLLSTKQFPSFTLARANEKNWDKNTPPFSKNSKKNFRQKHGPGETEK